MRDGNKYIAILTSIGLKSSGFRSDYEGWKRNEPFGFDFTINVTALEVTMREGNRSFCCNASNVV